MSGSIMGTGNLDMNWTRSLPVGPPGWADEIKPAQSGAHPGRCLGETGHGLPGEGVTAGLALIFTPEGAQAVGSH